MFLLIHLCMLLLNRPCSLNGFGNSFMTFVSTLAEAYRRLLPTGPLQTGQGRLSPLLTILQPSPQSTVTGLHRSSRRRQLMAAMQSGILTSERYGLTFPQKSYLHLYIDGDEATSMSLAAEDPLASSCLLWRFHVFMWT